MEVIQPSESQFPIYPAHSNYFPKPTPITMTISTTNGYTQLTRSASIGANPMMRVTLPREISDDPLASPIGSKDTGAFFNAPAPIPTHTPASSGGFANVFTRRRQSSIDKKPTTNGYTRSMRSASMGANPMMRVTLPREISDDPLASPIGSKDTGAFFNAPAPIPTHTPPPSGGFANVFTRRRQSSIEKKPPMPPSLRRTTSAPLSASGFVSKMAPMLKRVVSGNKTPSPAEEYDEDADPNARESLLMLLRVPDIQRESEMPLMMAEY